MWRILPALLTLALVSPLFGQAPATTVQLPTFSFFTVSTTVSVPDSGGVYLGGVSRAASGRVERGVPLIGKVPLAGVPFRNGAIGSTMSTSGMHVSASIIDHEEMDEAILAEAAAKRGGFAPETDKPFKAVGGVVVASGPGSNSAASGALSVAEIRRQQAAEEESQSAEGLAYLSKADLAAKEGKAGLAKVYYRMAAARLTGELARRAKSQSGN